MVASPLLSGAFWLATAERAVKTAAQAPLTAWLVGDGLINAFDVDWSAAAGLALGGAVVSTAFSLASIKVGTDDGPSLGAEKLPT